MPVAPPRTVLVTGASRGIGRATALRFAAAGDTTLVCARDRGTLDALRTDHPSLEVHACDMAEKAQVERLAAEVVARHGALDVLVNNVGIFLPGEVATEPDALFETLMHTNVFGTYYLTKRLLPPMLAKRAGTIVNVCSIASLAAHPNGTAYAVSKHALLGFSRGLRAELRPHGIRVVSILPGATRTDSWAGTDLPESRFMPPEDVAAAIFDACALSARTVVEELVLRPLSDGPG